MVAVVAVLVVGGLCTLGGLAGHLLAGYDSRCWCSDYCVHQRERDRKRRAGAGTHPGSPE